MNFQEVFLLFVFVFAISGFIYENLFKEWLTLIYITLLYPKDTQSLIPCILQRLGSCNHTLIEPLITQIKPIEVILWGTI